MWNPTTFPQIVNQNMKPFVLSPLPQIPVANMPGQTVIANMNADMNTGGYDQPNQGYGQMQEQPYYNENSNQQMNQNQNYVAPDPSLYSQYQPVYYNQ